MSAAGDEIAWLRGLLDRLNRSHVAVGIYRLRLVDEILIEYRRGFDAWWRSQGRDS